MSCCVAHRKVLTGATNAALQDRWAAASGFDDAPVDPDVAREVVMLCCAIKPLCAWNGQARPRAFSQGYRGRVSTRMAVFVLVGLLLKEPGNYFAVLLAQQRAVAQAGCGRLPFT